VRKADLTKERKSYFTARRKPHILEIESAVYVMVDGVGDPINSSVFEERTRLLYNLVGRMQSTEGSAEGTQVSVPPLEALWWTDNPEDFSLENRDLWKWTAMIMLPNATTRDEFERARARLSHGSEDRVPEALRLGSLSEGTCAQMLHIGPYADEGASMKVLLDFIRARGYEPRGKHHEIYLGNPHKVAPAKLRTIIRRPIEPKPSGA
jgi:hypothetical protein